MTRLELPTLNSSSLIQILDTTNDLDRLAFERAFYASFQRLGYNQLSRELWIWDDDKRLLKTRISYDDQIVFVLRDSSSLINAGMAVNVGHTHYQASCFGFQRTSTLEPSCEVLTAFSARENQTIGLFRLGSQVAHYLQSIGIRWSTATCTQKLLKLYLRFGGQLLGSHTINGDIRHHIMFDNSLYSCA